MACYTQLCAHRGDAWKRPGHLDAERDDWQWIGFKPSLMRGCQAEAGQELAVCGAGLQPKHLLPERENMIIFTERLVSADVILPFIDYIISLIYLNNINNFFNNKLCHCYLKVRMMNRMVLALIVRWCSSNYLKSYYSWLDLLR